MSRVDRDQLIDMALDVVETCVAEAKYRPIQRTRELRVVLATLAHFAEPGTRHSFVSFWRDGVYLDPDGRANILHAAANGIYLAVGRDRSFDRIATFREQAAKTLAL